MMFIKHTEQQTWNLHSGYGIEVQGLCVLLCGAIQGLVIVKAVKCSHIIQWQGAERDRMGMGTRASPGKALAYGGNYEMCLLLYLMFKDVIRFTLQFW